MPLIDDIRAKVADDRFEFSRHAVDQAIAVGVVIEDYPGDKYGPSCLVLGFTDARRPLHIQCSDPPRPLVKVITVYEPAPDS